MGDRDRSRSPRRRSNAGGGQGKRFKPVDTRIFVSNLPWEAKWQDVKDLFRKEVGEVAYVELFDDETGRPRGAGILEFGNKELAKKAIEKMHRYEYKGRMIVVKEDFDVDRDKYGRIITDRDRERMSRGGGGGGPSNSGGGGRGGPDNRRRSRSPGGGGGMPNFGNTYGLSPRFLESLGIDSPLHTRVFVANLDYTVDERRLKETFRLAGKVVGVELTRDKEGKSRGFAVVVYDHPVEAVQAISMFHDQQYFDRRMTVRFDKVPEEEPPRNLNRLPEGLRSLGMGLGQDGIPLWDVRANLPENTNQNNALGLGNMATSMLGQQGGGAANPNTQAAIQAALATIIGIAGSSNAAGGGQGALGAGAAGLLQGIGNGGGGGGLGGSGGGMGGYDRGLDMERSMVLERNMERMSGMDRGMGGMGGGMVMKSDRMDMGMDRGMGGGGMDLGMDRDMGGMSGLDRGGMGGMDRGMDHHRGMDRGSMGGMGGGMDRGGGMGGGVMGGGGGGYDGGMGGMDHEMGRGGMFMDRHGMMGGGGRQGDDMKRSDKIVVKNLAPDCTWQNLKERFSHAGEIKFTEVKKNGMGVIRFQSERDAERAVSMMNNQRVDGRTISVTLF